MKRITVDHFHSLQEIGVLSISTCIGVDSQRCRKKEKRSSTIRSAVRIKVDSIVSADPFPTCKRDNVETSFLPTLLLPIVNWCQEKGTIDVSSIRREKSIANVPFKCWERASCDTTLEEPCPDALFTTSGTSVSPDALPTSGDIFKGNYFIWQKFLEKVVNNTFFFCILQIW